MADARPAELRRLLQADPASRDQAWDDFVHLYTRLLLHTARSITREHDAAMDAYTHVLEALRQDDFRRLRAYTPIPGARFTTWLVAVARRLCVDQVRRRYGQTRTEAGASEEVRLVRSRLADLVADDVDVDRLKTPEDSGPERELRSRELEAAVAAAVAELSSRDRLLLSLRFDDARRAREIANLMGFATQFHVYRRLTVVLGLLKESLRRRGIEGTNP